MGLGLGPRKTLTFFGEGLSATQRQNIALG